MMTRRQSFEDLGQKHSWWKEQQQRPEMKIVLAYLRGGKKAGMTGTEWARQEAVGEQDLEALVNPLSLHNHLGAPPNSTGHRESTRAGCLHAH